MANSRTLAYTPTFYVTVKNDDLFVKSEIDMYVELLEAAAEALKKTVAAGVIISMGLDYADFPESVSLAITLDSPVLAS